MNLLLLEPDDLVSTEQARVSGRRFEHMMSILRVKPGDKLKAGILNGPMGTAQISAVNTASVELDLLLTHQSPPPLPVTVILALPRPKMLKRIFQHITTLGVKDIHLINSYRVEKSFWQSPWLSYENIHQQLLLGLEQARDTQLPQVHTHKRFKPFVEDVLPGMTPNTEALLALPGDHPPLGIPTQTKTLLVIGPEGGFIPYEVEKLTDAGCRPVTLGPRILKVETAVSAILGKML